MRKFIPWPSPTWLEEPSFNACSRDRQLFALRVAALYHNEKGSINTMSVALGYGASTLYSSIAQNGITPKAAIAIENLLGRDLFPREFFRPDIFLVEG